MSVYNYFCGSALVEMSAQTQILSMYTLHHVIIVAEWLGPVEIPGSRPRSDHSLVEFPGAPVIDNNW